MLAARRATDAAASLAAGARRVPRRRLISVSLFFHFFTKEHKDFLFLMRSFDVLRDADKV